MVRLLSTSRPSLAGTPTPEQLARAQAAIRAMEKRGGAPASRRQPVEEPEYEENENEEDEYDEYPEGEYDGEGEDGQQIAMVSQPAPEWMATALMPGGEFKKLSSDEFIGKWTVLFFYPVSTKYNKHITTRILSLESRY